MYTHTHPTKMYHGTTMFKAFEMLLVMCQVNKANSCLGKKHTPFQAHMKFFQVDNDIQG